MTSASEILEESFKHIGLADWQAKEWEIHETANNKKNESFDLRYESKSTILQTNIQTVWNNHLNNHKLSDRVTELSRWRGNFESVLDALSKEIDLLIEERADTEKELELLDHPLQIANRCIGKRNNRTSSEITYDDVDVQLRAEVDLIEAKRKLFTADIKTAWDKLNRLEEMKARIIEEIRDKSEATGIDSENLELSRIFPNFTYKPYALSIPEDAVSYESWLEHSRHTQQLAEQEMSDTYSLRESMRVDKDTAKRELVFQQDATDYALRRRAFATRKARNELDWQKLKIRREAESLRLQIVDLETALRAKADDLKCCETRLENRTYRPRYELCQDEPEFGLKDELVKLRESMAKLEEKINYAKSIHNDLEKILERIDQDLENKQHALTTDVMCLDMRSTLLTRDENKGQNETDRNIILTDLSKEISLETKKAYTT
ncbi:tektin-2-like [Trichogramma pretiosum]|uniref:tektin-2-like n=1 Tax=Trichogramma pretiosum TaxID=7493 RepID=UPI0006C9B57F|nr:tektin-2-like [Trichogramma pretiosum]